MFMGLLIGYMRVEKHNLLPANVPGGTLGFGCKPMLRTHELKMPEGEILLSSASQVQRQPLGSVNC